MAQPLFPLQVTIKLEEVVCYDEGDGWGNAGRYLWAVFFKIDGTSITVHDDLTISGGAVTHSGCGSHGNLGDSDVNEGDVVPVPSTIGEWNTVLHPIRSP